MKKSKKIWLIVAASLVVLGSGIFVVAMSFSHWDFLNLSTSLKNYETKTFEIEEAFRNISIETDAADVEFTVSTDGKCHVVCSGDEKIRFSAEVKNDTLLISSKNKRKWYFFTVNLRSPEIIVYLPEASYDTLSIDGSAGDICVKNTSCKVLDLSILTGTISVSDIDSDGDIKIHVSTGETYLTDIKCKNVFSEESTGDVVLKNVIASEKITVENSTGDIILNNSDAGELYLKTHTGDILGSLLSEKIFIADTSTGDVDVPKTTTGGKCEVTTSTGDIHFTY